MKKFFIDETHETGINGLAYVEESGKCFVFWDSKDNDLSSLEKAKTGDDSNVSDCETVEEICIAMGISEAEIKDISRRFDGLDVFDNFQETFGNSNIIEIKTQQNVTAKSEETNTENKKSAGSAEDKKNLGKKTGVTGKQALNILNAGIPIQAVKNSDSTLTIVFDKSKTDEINRIIENTKTQAKKR